MKKYLSYDSGEPILTIAQKLDSYPCSWSSHDTSNVLMGKDVTHIYESVRKLFMLQEIQHPIDHSIFRDFSLLLIVAQKLCTSPRCK